MKTHLDEVIDETAAKIREYQDFLAALRGFRDRQIVPRGTARGKGTKRTDGTNPDRVGVPQ